MTNIPIYRAKKVDSEEYIEGYLKVDMDHHEEGISDYLIQVPAEYYDEPGITCEIDKTTLAIHFTDMVDSEGNKIFASLSEDGRGGDIIDNEGYPFTSDGQKNYNAVVLMIFNQPQYVFNQISDRVNGASDGINNSFDGDYSSFKVIGIRQ